jgi:hypothetical protein
LKRAKYPTLLDLLHRGRRVAIAGTGVLMIAGSGCFPLTSGDVALPLPDATGMDARNDAEDPPDTQISSDDGVTQYTDLVAGISFLPDPGPDAPNPGE